MNEADPSRAAHPPPNAAVSATRRIARGWRWYHFYFILALFDLLVISASLFLYHRTVSSYEGALGEFSKIDAKQRWIARLRSGVIHLNAPGNDVFESRNPSRERGRFEQRRKHIEHLLRDEETMRIDLQAFRGHLSSMVAEEEAIFDIFGRLTDGPGAPGSAQDGQEALDRATASMAAMDRFQANAIASLLLSEQALLEDQQRLLNSYGQDLALSIQAEKAIFGTVVLILMGVFWYGRKLQRTYEQMQADQQRSIQQRHERLAAIGEVCSSVAHGIRNPLAAITSSAQLAFEFGTFDEPTKLRIQDILRESHRLNRRITRLLDFSGPPRQAFGEFDLVHAVQQALSEVCTGLDEKGTHVSTDFDGRRMEIFGDRESLTHCVIEILSNAIEHVPSSGHIQVICRRDRGKPGRARISVIDNGPGIADNIRDRVFDLFFTTKAEGHGIGLASVRKAVELHGGSVRVVPFDGQGTHIELTIPLA